MWAHRPGDEPKAGAVWNLGAEQQFKELFFFSSPFATERGRRAEFLSLLFRPECMAMEVSVRLRPTPASAASRRGRGRGSPPPPPSFPSARPASRAVSAKIKASAIYDLQRSKSNLESLFCYDKSVPEEDIGKPTGLDLEKKNVGKNPPCVSCEAKGAVLCATCAGSGLYVDSILESQGIIVKVRCLGCGGTGNIMCSKCGGRGHT